MNATTNIIAKAGHIPAEQTREMIARAVALEAAPSRFGIEWLNFLIAVDLIDGRDALADTIDDLKSDLGLTEIEPLGDDRAHDEGWTFGLYGPSSFGVGGSRIDL